MDCNEIQSAMFDLVDAGLPMSSEMKSHLVDCETCRLQYQRFVGVRQSLLRDVPPPAPLPEGFTARLMSAVAADRGECRPAARRLILRSTIAAMAACVLVGAVWMMLPIGHETGDGATASLVMTAPVELSRPLLADVDRLAGDPIAEEMTHFVEDTRQLGSSLLAELPVDLLPGIDRNWVESILPAAEAVDRPSATTNPHQTSRG